MASSALSKCTAISLAAALLVGWTSYPVAAQFNNPPGVEIWCGKAYRPENASFDPGGWLNEPARSSEPLLSLVAYPRWNLYTQGDHNGTIVVDAVISHLTGDPWVGRTSEGSESSDDEDAELLFIDIDLAGRRVVSNASIPVDSTENEIQVPLQDLPTQTLPNEVTVSARIESSDKVYQTKTQLYKLPPRGDNGSTTKLDNLNGGLWIKSNNSWTPIFPFTFYINWGGWLRKSLDNLDILKAAGYNMIHIVPDCGLPNKSFNFTELLPFIEKSDEIGMLIQYDMRCTYQNSSMVQYQVDLMKSHKSVLLWYTADEPDGNSDPTNATTISYSHIRSLDPWRPVSLVLNCQNFYYKEYSAGTDIIMSDVYPVGINATYSRFFHTVCNATYGCCGCDNCIGSMSDISTRFEDFKRYQQWLGQARKTFWTVPQAFGAEQHWDRLPTSEEVVVMAMLGVNHGAKGVVSWNYPTTANVTGATSQLAKVLTSSDITGFLLNGNPEPAQVVIGGAGVDAAVWIRGSQMLVSVVGLERVEGATGGVEIVLPASINPDAPISTVLSSPGWVAEGNRLRKPTWHALEFSLLVVQIDDDEVENDEVRAKRTGSSHTRLPAQYQMLR